MKHPDIRVSPMLVGGLCVFFYFDTLGLFLPLLLAASLHECAHLAVLRLTGVRVYSLLLSPTGACLCVGASQAWQEALCAAAGPLMNLLLAGIFLRLWTPFSLINLLLAAYNLLPLYPLDGGRLLRLLLVRLFGLNAGEAALRVSGVFLLLAVCALAAYATCVRHLGLWPCLLAASLLLRLPPNIACKKPRLPLQ